MTLAASNTPGRYEPLGANAPIKSFTGEACQYAADIWRGSGNPVHEAFAPTLDQWAANAIARAAAPIDGQPDLFAGDI